MQVTLTRSVDFEKHSGIVSSLKQLLSHADALVRQLSAEVLILFARHAVGRTCLLAAELPSQLMKSFEDEDDLVRRQVHEVLQLLSMTNEGAETIMRLGLVPTLVQKLIVEKSSPSILVPILGTLHYCLLLDQKACLDCNAMQRFLELSQSEDADVVYLAVRDIKDLR